MPVEPRVAVVGMGGVFPGAATPDRLWDHVAAATDASRDVPPGRWLLDPAEAYDPAVARPDRVYSRRGYFADTIDLRAEGLDLPPRLLPGLDPVFHLALEAGRQAFAAGLTRHLDRRRVGVVLGNIALPTEGASALARAWLGRTFEEKVRGDAAGGPAAGAALYGTGLPAGVLARALGLGGGSYTLDAACASSLYALKLAADELRAGRADAMLAGGVSRPDCLYTQMGFSQLRALSPAGRCRPFDAAADGLVVGEGAGVFLLKRLDDALRDGDPILALLAGVGLSNDVGGGLLAPAGEGQLRAMHAAYREAGWAPQDVDLVECHATGTPVGDAVEFQSLRALWGDRGWRPGQCVIGSVKSTVGHLLTAAGAAAVAKVLGALRAQTLPPTANYRSPAAGLDYEASPFRVLAERRPWPRRGDRPRRAAVSGFGFGGVNAHLLLEEWLPGRPARRTHFLPPPAAQPPAPAAVAVVGMEAHFGPWPSLQAFKERVLGGGELREPRPPARWWGVPASAWFRREGLDAVGFAGFFLDGPLAVAADRFRIPPLELREMLPQQLLMLEVAWGAMARAPVREDRRARTGVYLGLGIDLNTTNFQVRWSVLRQARAWARARGGRPEGAGVEGWARALADAAGPPLSANRTMGALGSIAASRIAREFRLGGPCFTLCGEEGSGLRALEAAVRALQRGEIDQALAGAVDMAGDVRAVLTAHARRPFSASGKACPFDAGADGTVPGEGAAAVVLKRLEDAVADGDTIHAVIRGVGVAGGGDGSVPDGGAYGEALRRAYAEARVDPATVGYLEAHAGGDPTADAAEARALAEFFGAGMAPSPLRLGSAKADVGHAGAAAGLASLVKACLCLDQQILPPLRNLSAACPELAAAPGRFRLPGAAQFWLRDRTQGPRRAGVSAWGSDGTCAHVVLEGWEGGATADRPDRSRPLGSDAEALLVVEGPDPRGLIEGLGRLRQSLGATGAGVEALARAWLAENPQAPGAPRAVALVARGRDELLQQIDGAARHLARDPEQALPGPDGLPPALRDRVFYAPQPLGQGGELALVFPGSGNAFPGMGRDLSVRWPEVLRRQDVENDLLRSQFVPETVWDGSVRGGTLGDRLIAQVALGGLVSDLLRRMGVRPAAAIGYSLGESAGLFALRAWAARDGMLRAMRASPLFTRELAAPWDAVRRAWGLAPGVAVDWVSGVVDRPPASVREACAREPRAYLLIVNTPQECVVGGDREAVAAVVRRLACSFVPVEAAAVHCPVVREVVEAYRELHRLPVTPPDGVRFYSAALGRAFDLDTDSAAEAVLAQALDTVDFPGLIEAAYRDGVRLFVEVGPGVSCTRMIGATLAGRPHRARPACAAGADGVSFVLRLLAQLAAERVPVDLPALYGSDPPAAAAPVSPLARTVEVPIGGAPFMVPPPPWEREGVRTEPPRAEAPPWAPATAAPGGGVALSALAPQITRTAAVRQAAAQAHAAYLRFSRALTSGVADTLAFQTRLLEALVARGAPPGIAPRPAEVPVLDHGQCLEFAVGSVGRVLGPDYAPIDAHPTRVRLPDEPLMLVDRVLALEGRRRSLGPGRVVTEHDVRPVAWYLDSNRIPTCVAVEAGQADLLLSAYLGIDFHTRGRAVYRLLDAAVTFHRGLPGPGAVIRYDIHIDHFFRQGETHLFRFRFEGSVGGEPLLTMSDGCAGFFTAEELAAGKGVVRTALDLVPRPGVRAEGEDELAPQAATDLDSAQLGALRSGDLGSAFGPDFAGLTLVPGLRLPGGRLKLVDRVAHLDPAGGRFGIGLIRAEADVPPDAWFLTCHFVDDRVMPGTLMYECCLHTLRVFLLRMGWVATEGDVACEPVPGVASRLKCRGQVTAATRSVTYEVILKERGYRPEPYALADALLYADGKLIVEITDMSVRLSGLGRARVTALWERQRRGSPGIRCVFPKERLLAFAVGKPSEAFGEPYRVFDRGRFIARLPGPPFQFIDRVVRVEAEPWKMAAGAAADAEYDVPPDAWYFEAERQPVMPFAVLLEVALQSCGWLAAYVGSALTSPEDLCFRNLGGEAVLHSPVGPAAGTLATRVWLTRVAATAGMILQHYDFEVRDRRRTIYQGTTSFGFFTRPALAQQAGLRDAAVYVPSPAERARGRDFAFPRAAPFPDGRLGMLDRVELLVPDGGPAGLGLIEGSKAVDPGEWFFKAHFHQDPVWPGSLGLEAFLQLMKVLAHERWPAGAKRWYLAPGSAHRWLYRGQVTPDAGRVLVQALVTASAGGPGREALTADGWLLADGRAIYRMNDFTLIADCSG
jgi:acyl transferase domain-containing protein/3-hydroxymyristoyl/3-hydroxydecanoyl-(acyl carrier protein) dehydratase